MSVAISLVLWIYSVELDLATRLRRPRFLLSRWKTGIPPVPIGWSIEVGPLSLYFERLPWRK